MARIMLITPALTPLLTTAVAELQERTHEVVVANYAILDHIDKDYPVDLFVIVPTPPMMDKVTELVEHGIPVLAVTNCPLRWRFCEHIGVFEVLPHNERLPGTLVNRCIYGMEEEDSGEPRLRFLDWISRPVINNKRGRNVPVDQLPGLAQAQPVPAASLKRGEGEQPEIRLVRALSRTEPPRLR
jgi:hypothetical protein